MAWSILLLLAVSPAVWAAEICLSVEEEPYLLFGTKTAYTFANRGLSSTKAHEVPGCEPIAFWMLTRPGSHNPEVDEIKSLQSLPDLKQNILNNYRSGQFRDTGEKICASDINILQKWQWKSQLNLTYAGELTADGYLGTQLLAQAWKNKFPSLISKNRYSYLFKFANDKRSKDSFLAFTEGLFGDQAEGFDIPKENDEKLITPYKFCETWTKQVEENNETLSQRHIFESKLDHTQMIMNISRRLGFNYAVHPEIIRNMYDMCRYNKAWDVSHVSPWCAAFSREDLKRLEYVEDLDTYYKYGYGSPLKNKIGCFPIKEMINFFSNHVSQESQQPVSMITISDAAMLLSAMTALGAHEDLAPLTGDNYKANAIQARKWTTSTMAPFNGNLAAILYKCTSNGNFQIRDEHQVLILENEKPVYLEGCRVGLCDWSLIKTRFSELVANCNLDFCNGAEKVNFGVRIAVLGVLVSLFSQFIL